MTGSLEDIKSKKFYIALLAEFIGTAFLVLVACGSCIGWPGNPPSIVQISLCFGFSVASIVWAICHVSGGHINPAVTIGFLVTRKISIVRGILYMVVQCLGALLGASLLMALVPEAYRGTLGTSGPNGIVSPAQTFAVELLITFIFVFVIFGTCDGNRKDLNGSGPLAIGLTIAMCHLWAVPVTGSGMNPARVLGPAVVSNNWTYHWAYWVGPLVGGAIAGIVYDLVFAVNATRTKLRGCASTDYDDADYDNSGKRLLREQNELKENKV